MTSVRDARATAITSRKRELDDNFTAALPRLLDDLDAIDQAHAAAAPQDPEEPAPAPRRPAPRRTAKS